MNRNRYFNPRICCLIAMLTCLSLHTWAQEGLRIEPLFEKYGRQKNVTRVELNGSILKSYRMTIYKSLIFKEVTPYLEEIQQAIENDKRTGTQKAQEVMESGRLLSGYYQLDDVQRKGKTQKRYILFKLGREESATLIYIEGSLHEEELMQMLYKKGKR